MSEFIYRTEEMTSDQVKDLFVPTPADEDIIRKLKAPTPVLLVGSRGVGKSFLFRVAQAELNDNFESEKILPVFITFRKASLLQSGNANQFQAWMLSKICSELQQALRKRGKLATINYSMGVLLGASVKEEKSELEKVAELFEMSWKTPGATIDDSKIPSLDSFINVVQDLCEELDIKRIVLFIDEAAHVFYPQQQREFFTLFRDLRSPYIKCNAAVYPGVTVYGDTFEPLHDAERITLNRSISDSNYIETMKEMVLKQAKDSALSATLSRRGENFSILAYASGGNPRHLLKTVEMSNQLDSTSVNKVIREYYRQALWTEHSNLSEKYPGYAKLIDWGRDFVETEVIPEIKSKNDKVLQEKGASASTSSFFWVHRHAPQEVKEALRLLEYTGIICEHSSGMRATRGELGSRYEVNEGCLFAQEATPTKTAFSIAKQLSVKKMTEYGSNYPSFEKIRDVVIDTTGNSSITNQFGKSIDTLDLTPWQKGKLHELGIDTIGELIDVEENKLKEARYIADVRARQMKNAAVAAVCEYLLG